MALPTPESAPQHLDLDALLGSPLQLLSGALGTTPPTAKRRRLESVFTSPHPLLMSPTASVNIQTMQQAVAEAEAAEAHTTTAALHVQHTQTVQLTVQLTPTKSAPSAAAAAPTLSPLVMSPALLGYAAPGLMGYAAPGLMGYAAPGLMGYAAPGYVPPQFSELPAAAAPPELPAAAALELLAPAPFVPPVDDVGLASLKGYRLEDRVAQEAKATALSELLMAAPGTLKANASVYVYEFPDCKHNDILFGLLAQVGKCKPDTIAKVHGWRAEDLTTGNKHSLLKQHVTNAVVLLPVSCPPGASLLQPQTLLNSETCACFSNELPGNLLMCVYKPSSGERKGRHVVLAWGCVTGHAYVNSLDLATRVRMFEDDPATTPATNHNQMVLPVHMLGFGEGTALETLFQQVYSSYLSTHAGVDVGTLQQAFLRGAPVFDVEAPQRFARLPPELRVFVPHLSSANDAATLPAADLDAMLYPSRALAVTRLATSASPGVAVVEAVRHLKHAPADTLALPATLRSSVRRVNKVRLGTVLQDAAKVAQHRFQ